MKKSIKIIFSLFFVLFIIGLSLINLPKVQDKLLDIGLERIALNAQPFLDKEDTLKVVVCGSRAPLPAPGRAETCLLVEAGDDLSLIHI